MARAADQLPEPRRPHHPRLPDAAGWPRSEEPGMHRQSGTAVPGARRLGLQPRSAIPGEPGFCVLQMNFRLDRLWPPLGSRLRPVGPEDAGRHQRWRGLAGQAGHRRSQARRHLRRQRRLRHAGRRDLHARPAAAAVDYVGVSNLFTFMQTIPPYWKPMLAKMQDMVGDPVRDKDRLGRDLAGAARGPHQDAAVRGPGRQGSARQQGRKRPDGQGAEGARRQRGVHGQGQRGPRLPQRREQVRVLRGHGEVPAPAPRRSRLRSRGAGRDGRIGRFRPALRRPVPGRGRAETDRAAGFHPVAAQFLARYNATSARARMPSAVSRRAGRPSRR